MLIITIILVILIAIYLVIRDKKEQVDGATNLQIIKKERIDNMERYTFSWIPAKKDFAETQQIWASVDGGAENQVGIDMAMATNSATVKFPTGSSGYVYVRTIGDNDTINNSASLSFTADNEDVVDGATGLTLKWEAHEAD